MYIISHRIQNGTAHTIQSTQYTVHSTYPLYYRTVLSVLKLAMSTMTAAGCSAVHSLQIFRSVLFFYAHIIASFKFFLLSLTEFWFGKKNEAPEVCPDFY